MGSVNLGSITSAALARTRSSVQHTVGSKVHICLRWFRMGAKIVGPWHPDPGLIEWTERDGSKETAPLVNQRVGVGLGLCEICPEEG
eukprot:m.17806 g.17806  ORF g.17806 m.17806 type:complete len:87 (-) comp5225_c0_seq1:737-997(-)